MFVLQVVFVDLNFARLTKFRAVTHISSLSLSRPSNRGIYRNSYSFRNVNRIINVHRILSFGNHRSILSIVVVAIERSHTRHWPLDGQPDEWYIFFKYMILKFAPYSGINCNTIIWTPAHNFSFFLSFSLELCHSGCGFLIDRLLFTIWQIVPTWKPSIFCYIVYYVLDT